MRRPPPISFRATRADRDTRPAVFDAVGGEGRIEFRGGLSAGSPGWCLSASASWRRNVIDIYVTARQDELPQTAEVEDHDYEAVVEVPPGFYRLRLRHVYLLPDARITPLGLPIFERGIKVS